MASAASQSGPHTPRRAERWGVMSATFWSVAAFFGPQILLLPLLGFFAEWPLERNAKVFMLQGLAEVAALAVLWVVIRRLYHAGLGVVGLGRLNNMGLLGWSVLAFPIYLVLSVMVSGVLAAVFGIDLSEHQDIGYANPNGYELLLIFVALVLLAPFVEEVLFRGFLFAAFRRTFGFWLGAVGVSLLFAAAHGQVNVAIDVFVLSMFLCYLREKTESLWPAIALHALKNLVAFVVLFIIKVN